MHVFLLATLALAIPATASAYEGNYLPWTEAAFTTVMPAPYGRVQLNLKVEGPGRLVDVGVVREGGVTLRVPAVAYANVFGAQVNNAGTTFKHSFDGTPWLFVHIPFGEPIKVRGQPEWTTLVIAFRGDRAVYRALNVPRPNGGFDWQPNDLPRE